MMMKRFSKEELKKFKAAMKHPVFHRRYIFTDKKHPLKGIMSFLLGAVSAVSVIAAVRLTYINGGQAQDRYAVGVIFALIYSVCGFVLGILSKKEKDIFSIFPNMGILINTIMIVVIGFIIYSGI